MQANYTIWKRLMKILKFIRTISLKFLSFHSNRIQETSSKKLTKLAKRVRRFMIKKSASFWKLKNKSSKNHFFQQEKIDTIFIKLVFLRSLVLKIPEAIKRNSLHSIMKSLLFKKMKMKKNSRKNYNKLSNFKRS